MRAVRSGPPGAAGPRACLVAGSVGAHRQAVACSCARTQMAAAAVYTHQLQVLARDLAHCQVAVDEVDGQEQRLGHQLQQPGSNTAVRVSEQWLHGATHSAAACCEQEGSCCRAYLELEVHLHQPVDEDGAHLLVDVRLQDSQHAYVSTQAASVKASNCWLMHAASCRLPFHPPANCGCLLRHVLVTPCSWRVRGTWAQPGGSSRRCR
jgi:hypothetical protein